MSNKTSDKMSDKLLPCPFCGGEARMQKKFFNVESVALMRFQVACMECGANNDWYTDKGYAIKAWNTRKPMEWYEELESKLQSVYGECDGLLKAVVDGVVERLVKHEGAEFEKLNKARLLMDENVEKWDRLKGAMERIVERLEERKDYKVITNQYGDDIGAKRIDSINIDEAIEIVREEM